MDLSASGDQIWVKAGTYKPTTEVGGTGDRFKTFQMKNGVEIYGGFAGTEDPLTFDLAERDITANETILSGDLSGDDTITGYGQTLSFSNNSENCYHVIYHPDAYTLNNSTLLDGFTVMRGKADGDYPFSSGAGIYNGQNSSCKFQNIIIKENYAARYGGMFNNSSNSVYNNIEISKNMANLNGGGAGFNASNASFNNALIHGNFAETDQGGGVYIYGGQTLTFNNVTISKNVANNNGGGIYNENSILNVNNSIVYDNSTISSESTSGKQLFISSGTDNVNYSCYSNSTGDVINESGTFTPDANCITTNPRFVDVANTDFRIYGNSPCVDAGNDSYNALTTDIRGVGFGRKLDKTTGLTGTIDMGAYEYKEGTDPERMIIFVDTSKSDGNSGFSWTNAKKTFQAALDLATEGAQIWVKAGTYKPTSAYNLTNTSRFYHFRMKNGVAIYGGFAGTEDPATFDLATRDFTAHPTILSGDIGTIGDITDNCYHVFYHPSSLALNSTAVLDGFTIRDGYANGDNPHNYGAGIYDSLSSPTLNNLIITNNNTQLKSSGGVPDGKGGAIYCYNSSSKITNTKITNNNSFIGGGLFITNSSPTLTNVLISKNRALSGDPGPGSPCDGGGAYIINSNPTFNNVTISNNYAHLKGGGIGCVGSTVTLNNSIIWGNKAAIGGNQFYFFNSGTNLILNNSCYSNEPEDTLTQGNPTFTPTSCITSNPKFVDTTYSDFRIYGNSPCVDAGHDDYNDLTTDIRGTGFGRKLDKDDHTQIGTIDMGAYEYKEGTDPERMIIFVDTSKSDANNGLSWANAKKTLQAALDLASSGDQIWVKAGKYLPTNQLGGTGERFRTFQMKNGVEIYGGFAGTEDPSFDLATRDFVTNETILSGDIGILNDSSDNCYHVFYHPEGLGLTSSAVLDGFTISGANADAETYHHNTGGAIFILNSSPVIRNCKLTNNRAVHGSALFLSNSSSELINLIINNNKTSYGTVCILNASSPVFINNLIYNNTANVSGAGILNSIDGNVEIINTTIANNIAYDGSELGPETGGGGLYSMMGTINIKNSILWGNTAEAGSNFGNQIFVNSGTVYLSYCDIEQGIGDIVGPVLLDNSISSNPGFANPENDDFRLYFSSPCVNVGNNTYNTESKDIRGQNRIQNTTIDMGAYEWTESSDPWGTYYVTTTGAGTKDGTSWANAFEGLQNALDVAVSCDTIWVKAGTYNPTSAYDLTDSSRYYHFRMKNGVKIYGGFAGTENPATFDLANRDFTANETILSGDIGNENVNTDNCYHIFYHPNGLGLTSSAVLDGFTISGANANEVVQPHYLGGAIFIDNSSPVIRNCWLRNNRAGNGSAIFLIASSSEFVNVIVSNNEATSYGTIFIQGPSSPIFNNNLIFDNTANFYGAGILNFSEGGVEIINTTITNNAAIGGSGNGGGLYNISSGTVNFKNSILWGNTADAKSNQGNQIFISSGAVYLSYCDIEQGVGDIEGPVSLDNTISSNPKFVDAANSDFRIYENSPCVDAGDNDYNDLTTDIRGAGFGRKLDKTTGLTGTIDMGVYEYKEGTDPEYTKIFVNVDMPNDSSDGFVSWSRAKKSFQSALEIASYGDTIWVAAGTYKPTSTYDMDDTTCNYHFRMKNGVKIYGGFAGTENPATFDLADRDFTANETILSGDLLGNDEFDINQHGFIDTTGDDNCYHVFYHPDTLGLDNTAILDGFTIKGGNADGDYGFANGGGIYNITSSPKLTNLILTNNFADDDGGGIYNTDNSEPVLTNITIIYNFAYNGGGMFNENSSPSITNTTISNNVADYGAGIVNNENSSPTITNSIISYNNAESYCGGILNEYYSSPILTDVIITYNSSMYEGGGIVNVENSSPFLTNVTISYNSSLLYGGGIINIDESSPIITNAIISNNSSMYGGGICNMENSTPTITNSTISYNSAMYGGGISNMTSLPTINNSIIWGNTGVLTGNQVYSVSGGSLTLNYSCFANEDGDIFGSHTANNCITTNPEFVDLANDDFRIAGSSPCVNSGNNAYVLAPNPVIANDFRGQARIQNTTIDMGAFEWTAGVDPICKNPTNGGTIAAAQTICYNTAPAEITNSTAPTGYSGTLEYKWQKSTTSGSADFTDIESSNSEDYSPAALTQTTWYKRLARVNCQNDWTSAVESNVIEITIRPQFTAGAIATEGEMICNNTGSFTQITSSTAASGGDGTITYKWQANGVDIPSSNSATFTPPSTLTATTTYTRFAKDGTCNTEFTQSTGSWTVTINPVVSAALSGNATICRNTLANLYVTLTGTAPWSVSFSDGVTIVNILNSNYARAVSPNSTTIYTITDVTDANGCSAVGTGSATITIRPTSTAVLSGGGTICAGETANLTVNLTGIAPYYIDFSDGFSIIWYFGNTFQRQVSPNTTTNYTITVTDGCNLAADVTGTADVTVSPLPTAYNVTGGGSYCYGGDGVEIGLDDSESGVNYQLLRNGNNVGSPVAGTGSAISFGDKTLEGTYTVKATNATTSCENTMTGSVQVTINQLPLLFAVTGGGSYCTGGTGVVVGLEDSENGINYQLKLNGTNSGTPVAGTGSAISFGLQTGEGTYTVEAIIGTCTRTMTGSASISINPLPTATISGTTLICPGESADLTVTLTGTAPYYLTFNDGFEAVANNYTYIRTVSPVSNTDYSITNVEDAYGCSNSGTGTASITINAKPTATLSGDAEICAGSSTDLSVALTGTAPWTIVYSDGVAESGILTSPHSREVTPNQTTIYTITSVTDANCSNIGTGSATVTINAKPTAVLSGTTTICEGTSALLTVHLTGEGPWSLIFSDNPIAFIGITSSPFVREVSPTTTTVYTITSVNDVNCSNTGTGSATVTVNAKPTATLSGDAEICAGSSTDLSVALTGTAPWTIVYSDGVSESGILTSPHTREVTPSRTTVYTITNVTDANCSNTGTGSATVTINAKPTAVLSGTTYICAGSSTELKVALTGEAPWSLTFSDSPTPIVTSSNPYVREVSPATTTAYTITNVTDNNGCSNAGTGSATITVNPLPTATISGTTSICNGEHAQITVNLTGMSPFLISFNDGSFAFVSGYTYKKTVKPTNPVTNYSVTSVIDAYGCSNTGTGTATITLNQLPTALITGDAEICLGSSTDIAVALTGQAPWTIVFSDRTSITTSSNPYIRTVSPNQSCAYGVTSVTDGNGCENTGSGLAIIIVNPKPTATIYGTTAICDGGSAILTVELTGEAPWSLTFSDDPTNPITGIISSPYQREVSPTVSTNYTLLNVTDGNGCSNYGLGIAQIIVRPLPTATISGDATICSGESTDLTVTLTGIAPFGLTFSDGYQVVSYLTTCTREVSPNQTTNYTITEVTDGYFCTNVGTGSALVTVNPQPSAVISGTATICYGADADLTVDLIGKAPWNLTFSDNVTIDNIQTTPYTRTIENITENITYTITNVTDACGLSAIGTGAAEITVGNLPTAEITGTTAICNGESTDLTVVMTGPSPWSLTFSDGFVIDNLTTSPYIRNVSPTGTTTYTVSITDDCGNTASGTGEAEITVHPLPTASISGTNEICIGETADLTVILTGEAPWSLTFSDDPLNPITGIETSPYTREVSPVITTNYTVTNVTDGNSCENIGTGVAEITVNPLPTAAISGNSTICYGTSADITVNLTGTAPFTIEFADGFIASNVNTLSYQRSVSPTETTGYSIVSVIDFNGCENTGTGTATITVRPLPEAVLSGDASICYGANTDLTVDLIGTAPFTIEFEDGFIAENVNDNPYIRNVNPLTTTTYTLVNVTDGCGLSTTGTGSATIEVGDLPTATISGSTSICDGMEADLTVDLTGTPPWSITFSDNVTIDDIQTSPYIRTVSPIITTVYTIIDVTDGCNNSVEGTGSATITINPLPTAEISGDATICFGESTVLNVVMTGNGPFTLEFSDGFVAEDINSFTYQREVSPTETTIYTITAIIDACNTNIAGTGSATVTVNPLPTATLSGDDAICSGSIAVLTVNLTGTAPWQITFSDSYVAENVLSSPYLREVAPTEDVVYTITNVTDGNGCENVGTGSATITINPLPTASLSGEQTICYGTAVYLPIQLTGTPPFYIVFEDGWSAARINTFTYYRKVKPLVTTVYSIASITDANGCTNTSDGEATIYVNPLPLVFNVVGEESVVALDGSELGITYFLQLNGVETGLSQQGTGSSISFGEQTVAGSYTVLAVNDLTDCRKLMNGSYIIGGRESAASQVIDLQTGWNLISSYIEPNNPDINDIFGGIANQINIVKTGDGLMYVPAWDLNTIRNWNSALGYAINATSATQLVMQGENIAPEYYPIQLNDGWNLISYVRDNQTSPEFALSSIEGDYILVKNNNGGVFAPAWGLNTLGYMNPGEAYYIYTNDNAVLTYPSNSAQRAVAGEHFTPLAKHISPQFSNTGNNATLLINLDSDNDENEIAVFNQNNEILGIAAIENGVAVVTIWGDDEITNEVDGAVFNEPIFVKLFNTNTLEYQELSLTRIKEITDGTELDELKYRTNAIYSARVSAQSNANSVLSIKNVPNPASSYTTFEFSIANDGDAEILIYSMKGDLVARLGNKEYKAGIYKLNFETGEMASGVYNVILRNGTERATTLMIIQK
ncbi:MAG TPA: choice-of-anchor Q domain-containing protein [Candidatus Kapabacteria bacterium]|nr:choice-of-anchor Q domain-containing protein [Candidatus Kapabacteria bacterium]